MIDWSFSFVRVLEGNPIIDLVCSFRDGRSHLLATSQNFPEVISQMNSVMQLLSYIAYFPGQKDFTKIKLNTAGNQFAVHFLDKRQFRLVRIEQLVSQWPQPVRPSACAGWRGHLFFLPHVFPMRAEQFPRPGFLAAVGESDSDFEVVDNYCRRSEAQFVEAWDGRHVGPLVFLLRRFFREGDGVQE